ncbi:PHA/PHB synthase family protein [Variovorax sp. PBL-E5]|uniref:PHA/PHB synthase family protein n=1 Tax=Variovorax sp. PBL-E5 TaxID=434014 RepID=UPI0013185C50|nr:alpha/beta fold hydrolase [Variovorax sp. PBL-E5]VTU22164.1 Poly-beta-hydroxybutyrate polymerase [Variovorax sp. PBL-E5]
MNEEVNEFDRMLHAAWGRLTRGMSPAALILAWADWAIHMAAQPERCTKAWTDQPPWLAADRNAEHDPRLRGDEWERWPFDLYRRAFETGARWLHGMTDSVPGVDRHHAQLVAFMARQWHAMGSPANFPATNPQVLQRTVATAGLNLLKGAANWIDDARRSALELPPAGAEAFEPGREVAATPGKVILRNRLIELIQYTPVTATVHAEPVLIVSAWIMKYYVLDLSAHNSLIRFLVGQGHTVFAVSWKNPDASDRDFGMSDYLKLGFMASLDAIGAVLPRRRIHAVGYCLGGTLLAIGAAAMARDHDGRLATLTLLAAQTDFTEPGELSLFIDESQLAFLEDVMSRQGYLSARRMAGAFQLLRAQDLVWTPMVRNYLLGERMPMTDLMAWNADGTRMPYRMHADYLRSLFLDNALAEGHYLVDNRPVSLKDIEVPVFALGTRTDHVAPWRSVYKFNLLCDADITFVLTDGGHNAGIVSEPGHARRSYCVLQRARNSPYVGPDDFLLQATHVEGSWWPLLQRWLADRSGPRRKPPRIGSTRHGLAPICDAPGTYVLEGRHPSRDA